MAELTHSAIRTRSRQMAQQYEDRQLRVTGDASRSCSYCTMFRTVRVGNPHDDGECGAHGDLVRGDFTCSSFSSGEEDAADGPHE